MQILDSIVDTRDRHFARHDRKLIDVIVYQQKLVSLWHLMPIK